MGKTTYINRFKTSNINEIISPLIAISKVIKGFLFDLDLNFTFSKISNPCMFTFFLIGNSFIFFEIYRKISFLIKNIYFSPILANFSPF